MHPLRPVTFRRAAAVVSLGACALLAACGTATPIPKSRAANFADAPGVSNGEIRVGELVDASPVTRAVTDGQSAFWSHVNEDLGGIAGHRVTPVVTSIGNDPATAAARTQTMLNEVALISQLPQPTALAAKDALAAANVVALPVSQLSSVTAAPSLVLTATPLRAVGAAAVNWILSTNQNAKLGLAVTDDDNGRDVRVGAEAAAKAAKLELTEVALKPNQDPAQLAGAFNKANVTDVVFAGPPPLLAAFAGATAPQAQRPTIVATADSYSPKLLATPQKDDLGKVAKVIGPFAPWGDDVAGMRPMLDATARFKPVYLQNPDQYYLFGWVQAELAFQILQKAAAAGDLSHAGITAARVSLGDVDTGDLTPDLTIRSGEAAASRVPSREVRLYDVAADDPNAPTGLKLEKNFFAADPAAAIG